ncbi:SwmB domain-containing protein [Gracilibacillus dipsosauri]|uniref:Bacterial Ig-like domain-containing protein n=1 Tax=Gracilibacillus dipsosauri TaxID=178340 RepID=A0A317L2W4_9BACI|nr:SwmB domain-containing protein [Gracilibacillus dipsosauri]PWU69228.1 hypothetical protein DLJ74_04360 [Gracilibacillus dipsosauri]
MKKFKSEIAVFLIIVLLIGIVLPGGATVFAATPDYEENGDFNYDPLLGEAAQVDPDFTVEANGEQFAEGNIRFEITDSNGYTETDRLFIPEGESVPLGDGSTLTYRNGQFLLDDVPIASVNNTDNGYGTALQIDLSAPLPNGNFEEGAIGEGVTIPSWTINNQSIGPEGDTINQIWLGDLASKTQNRPYDAVVDNSDGTYTVTGPDIEYTYNTNVNYNDLASTNDLQNVEGFEAIFTSLDKYVQKVYDDVAHSGKALEIGFLSSLLASGDYAVKDGKIASSFGIEAISSSFQAKKGDKLSFDWKANDGGDDYEVYGFLVDLEGNHTEILYGRGSAQGWTTNSGEVPADGTYKFRFVAGSFNRTDGTTHGATLSIDNIRVVSSQVVEGVVNAIGQMVHYSNDTYSGNRPVYISVINGEGNPSKVVDPDATIHMSTKEEASDSLGNALTIEKPRNDTTIYDPAEKTIEGLTEPGTKVSVIVTDPSDNVVFNGLATVAEDGNWSIELENSLIIGEYNIEATASKGGSTSDPKTAKFTYVDKLELENYYNEVKDLVEADYQDGWDDDASDDDPEFAEALENAKKILEDITAPGQPNPHQAAINLALEELKNAKDALVRVSPEELSASFEHGYHEIMIEFDKDVTFNDPLTATNGFTVIVGEGEDVRELTVNDAVANGNQITLIVDEMLNSDEKVIIAYAEEVAKSNLIGAEAENPGPVRDFDEKFPATDDFGAALQMEGTTGITDDSTPLFYGTVDKEVDSVTLNITDLAGNPIKTGIPAVVDITDGTWTVTDAEWDELGGLEQGDYKVVVTAAKEGRNPVTKEEEITVVNKSNLQREYDEVDEFVEDDYRKGWADFEDARNYADEVLDNPIASQDDVDQALIDLEEARGALEKHPPVETNPANYEHGDNKITIEFDKNIALANSASPEEGFTVTVDETTINVIDAVANDNKVMLTVDQPLNSDTEEVRVMYTPNEENPNLFGAEENGAPDEPFDITATDEFGKGLQIIGTKGNTDDRTPSFNGEMHLDADNVILTIVDSKGNELVIEEMAAINGEGWILDDWTELNELLPGNYTVYVTAKDKDSGRTVAKSADFTVVDKTTLEEAVNSGKELVEDDHRANWGDFAKKLEKAIEVFNNPTASQDDVNTALDELESTRDELEKHPAVAEKATFHHGQNEITIVFDKNVLFTNDEIDPKEGFIVTVDGEKIDVIASQLVKTDTESKTNKVKLILSEGVALSSDALVQVHYNQEAAKSNLYGDEENGTAVVDFTFIAGDPFGQALQIDDPNGITNDLTPIIKGTAHDGTETATITISGPNGDEMVVEGVVLVINSDGTWEYNIEESLEPGKYKVEVTTSQAGRPDVTKDHYFTIVDKTELIATDDNITGENLVEGEYTENSWTQFEEALNHARDVIANPEAIQTEVEQANANLEQAYNALVYKQALEEEKKKSEGLEESHYSEASWGSYRDALEHAQDVLSNLKATQAEIDEAKIALAAARAALTVDKTLLDTEENKAQELNREDYSEASWETYQKAVKAAQVILNNPNATQAEIDAAKVALAKARLALKVDREALVKEESKSDKLTASDYSEESWNAFQKALEHAKAVLADENTTQAEVNGALSELNKAREALEKAEKDLPDTATDIFNWLLMGSAILIIGIILLMLQNRRGKVDIS